MDCHVPEECPSVELVYSCMIWINRINLVLSSVSIYLFICPRSGLQLHDLEQQDESRRIFCINLSIYLSILDLVHNCMIWNSKMNLILFSVSIYLSILELVYSYMIWISRMNHILFSVSIYLSILELVYICMIWISRINLILFSVSIYLS